VSWYQKSKTNLDFTEARDSEWQWHHLGYMLQRDNHAAPHHSVFLQTGCPSCHPTNSVKALKATLRCYQKELNVSDKQSETGREFQIAGQLHGKNKNQN